MKWIFFLLFASGLFATVNEPLRWEFFTGYRNDRIHWHLQEPAGGLVTESQVYRDIEYWLNGLVLKVIHRDLVFFARGAYGAWTRRWCADARGYFGYAVNLTADRTYKVILTPLVGYAGYFEQIHKFHMVWNGFFLGGQFTFETGGPVILNAGWAYNMVHNRVHSPVLKTSSGGNKGQLGWAQIDWNIGSCWRMGLGGEMLYLTTRVVNAKAFHMDQKFKLRWTPVSGWVQVSRTF